MSEAPPPTFLDRLVSFVSPEVGFRRGMAREAIRLFGYDGASPGRLRGFSGGIVFGGSISGAGGITLGGTGAVTLAGNNSYSSSTIFAARQTLNINHANALGIGTLVASGNGLFDNTSGAPITITNNFNLSGGSPVFIGTTNLTINGVTTASGAASRTLTVAAGTLTLASIGGTNFTKSGAGTLALAGAAQAGFQNTFTLTAGTLILGDKGALGTGTLKIGASGNNTTIQGSTDLSGANAVANPITWVNSTGGATNIFSGSNNITLSGNQTAASSGSTLVYGNTLNPGKKLLVSGNVTVDPANPTTYVITGTGNTEFSGNLSDSGSAILSLSIGTTGTGITTLSGSNTYSGTTAVNGGGLLVLNSANALPSASYLLLQGGVLGLGVGDFTRPSTNAAVAGTVRFNNSGGFAAFGADRQVNLFGDGRVMTWNAANFVPGSGILILGADSADKTVTFVNPIVLATAQSFLRTNQVNDGAAAIDAILAGGIGASGSGTNSFIKTGAGTLELTGVSSYRGYTTVDSGRLMLASTATNGLGYTVNNASLVLTGNTAFLQTPTLTLANAGAYVSLLGGTTEVTQASLGLSFVSGATIDIYSNAWLALPKSANANNPWDLASLTGIANSTFKAAGSSDLSPLAFQDGSGALAGFTMITLIPIPEPTTLLAAISGLALLGFLRRKRVA